MRSSPTCPRLPRLLSTLGRGGVWVALALTALLLAAAGRWVDLAPRVESDFFFASDDPQLQATREVERLFPSAPQILISAAAPEVRGDAYVDRVAELTGELAAVEGAAGVRSLTSGPPSPRDAFDSPLWRRLLVAPDESATHLFVELSADADPAAVVAVTEDVLARFDRPGFDLAASGVPYVVEQIRRHLLRDLRLFSLAAFVLFGALITLVYRDLRIAAGTLVSCLAAAAATLLALRGLGIAIGPLTANLATLVFVLTLSHVVFLTANWRRLSAEGGEPAETLGAALQRTAPPSFWAMATTLLGFASLRFASARPLQELGAAGAVGAIVALSVAYTVYPGFLLFRLPASPPLPSRPWLRLPAAWHREHRRLAVAALAVLVAAAALGLPRLDTDPELPSYFAAGSVIREGLERIDRDGGSSPLSLVYAEAAGGRLDDEEVLARLAEVQAALEKDPAVGTVLSLPVLVEEARRVPLAALLPLPNLLDLLATENFDRAARAFVDEDRLHGLFLLRMRETGRPEESRARVVERLAAAFTEHGFEVETAGGLYELQGRLSELVVSSLWTGLGALTLLFAVVSFAVSRSAAVSAAMLICLVGTPLLLFGAMGHLRLPLDVISSPAANVAVAIGIDSMIHLVSAVRRRAGTARASWQVWAEARHEMWRPILGAAGLLAAGFGLFALSSFPPTRRFGLAVVLGLAAAAAFTLLLLPRLAARRQESEQKPTPLF